MNLHVHTDTVSHWCCLLFLIYTGWPKKVSHYQIIKKIIFCTSLGNSADKLRHPEMCCLFSIALSSTE